MYRLVFLTGSLKGRRLTVQQGDVLIGRDRDCHLRMHHPSVLGRHAMLEQRGGGCYIRSLDATAFLRVNDQPVRDRRLVHGDEIDIGEERLLFQQAEGKPVLQKRRVSKFHGLTYMAVSAIILLQILVITGLVLLWHVDPIEIPMEDSDVEQQEEKEEPEHDAPDEELELLRELAQEREQEQEWGEESDKQPALKTPFSLLPEWHVTPVWECTE